MRIDKKKSQRLPAASSSPGERSPCFQLRRPHRQELLLSEEAWICRSGVGGGDEKFIKTPFPQEKAKDQRQAD